VCLRAVGRTQSQFHRCSYSYYFYYYAETVSLRAKELPAGRSSFERPGPKATRKDIGAVRIGRWFPGTWNH
jgi:hypothetical protein